MNTSKSRRRAIFSVAAVAVAAVLLVAACTPPPSSGGGGGSQVTAVPSHGGFQMVANKSKGFYSLPYPNAIRTYADGTLDLRGLPGSSNNIFEGDPAPTVPFLSQSVSRAARTVVGFGTNTAIYFSSTVDIDPSTLPTLASSSQSASSTVMLIDLDNGYARHPVLPVWEATGDRFRPHKLLTILPYPGHPLKSSTNYAVVLFSGIQKATGGSIDPAPLISQLDQEWSEAHGVDEPTWAALQAQRATVEAAVTASTTWSASDIAAFTVYRTQDASELIDGVEAAIAELPAPTISVTSQSPCAVDNTVGGGGATNSLIVGTFNAPNFQGGYYPFFDGGGKITLDELGKAVVHSTKNLAVRIRVPCGAPPAGGWPTVAHVGEIETNGNSDTYPPPYNYGSYVFAETPAYMAGATEIALTIAGISASQQPGLLYANFINPAAGRANPVQQAANHISLARALEAFSIDGTTVGTSGTVITDDGVTVASGHGQGALTLPLVAKAAPGLEAVYSSSGAGGLYHTLAHTSQRHNLALFTGEHEPLDELNPLVQLVQTVAEANDGLNVDSADLPAGLHYVNVTGANDGCVATEGSRHLARSLGLALGNRQWPDSIYGDATLDPLTSALPISANGPGGATRAQLETAGGHAQALANLSLGTGILADLAAHSAPDVPSQTYLNTYGVCGWRYDFLGGDPFGRV